MRYWILANLCLAALIAYVQRLGIYTDSAGIRSSLGIDKEQLGLAMSAWTLGYAALQIPCGWLADRWGSRRALTVFAVIWSISTGLTSLAGDQAELVALWCAMGMAQAGLVPCAAKAVGQWFPDTERATASGLLASAMAAGIALAPALSGRLMAAVDADWRDLLRIYTVPGLLWAVLFFTTTPARPPASGARPTGGLTVGGLLGSVSVGLLCAQQFFRAFVMAFFMTWFPTFLQDTRGLSPEDSGYLTGIVGVGSMVGGLLGGFTSDWLFRRTGNRRLSRQGIAVVGLAACGGLLVAGHLASDVWAAVGLWTAGALVATFGGISGYTVAIELGGRHVATVFSLMNTCGNVGSSLFPYVAGRLVASAEARAGGGWDAVIYLVAAIFLVDATCWAVLNPKKNLDEEPL